MTGELIRVMLADDHQVVRTGIKAMLAGTRDVVVVGEASSGMEAIALAARLHPDVVVMDLALGDMDGVAATREIRAGHADTKVLILTMHDEQEYLAEALKGGAAGYLVKSAAHLQLVDAIRAVAYGDVFVRPAAGPVLAKRIRPSTGLAQDRERLARLTDREREVLRLVAAGYSAPAIGSRLAISPKTVDTYKQRVNEKLNLSSRPDYVRFALRLGLLSAETIAG